MFTEGQLQDDCGLITIKLSHMAAEKMSEIANNDVDLMESLKEKKLP